MHVCWKEQVDRRKWDAANNVVTVLTKYEGPAEDEKIIKVRPRSSMLCFFSLLFYWS